MTQIFNKKRVNQQFWIKAFDIVGQTATIAFLSMTVIIHYLSTWMHQVKIPLDIIYLDNGVITHIAANSIPCATSPESCPIYKAPSATHVIELNAGRAARLNFQVGDRIKLESRRKII